MNTVMLKAAYYWAILRAHVYCANQFVFFGRSYEVKYSWYFTSHFRHVSTVSVVDKESPQATRFFHYRHLIR